MKPATAPRNSRSKKATLSDTESLADVIDRSEHIAVSAYYKALARGFAPGRELDDWLQAEAELSTEPPRM